MDGGGRSPLSSLTYSLQWYMSRPPSMQLRARKMDGDYTEALAKGYVRVMHIPKTLPVSKESSEEAPMGIAMS